MGMRPAQCGAKEVDSILVNLAAMRITMRINKVFISPEIPSGYPGTKLKGSFSKNGTPARASVLLL
jgi:hypothetical protein